MAVKPPSGLVDRLAILSGASLLIGGVGMVSVPAALMLAGVLLLVGTMWRIA